VLTRVRAVEGVQTAVSAQARTVILASQADQWQLAIAMGGAASGGELLLYGIDPVHDAEVRVYKMAAGRFLSANSDEQAVVLVQDYARDNEIKLGKDLEILTPAGTATLTVVGFMTKDGPGLLNNGAFGVVPLEVLQDLFALGREINQIDVVAAPEIARSPDAVEALKVRLEERLGRSFNVSYPAARGQLVTQILSAYQQGLGFMSIVALFVGAFLIYNTFSMTIVERTRETGMLRALGMTRGQVVALVLTEALALGAAGSGLGLLGGIGLAQGLMKAQASVIGTTVTQMVVPPSGLVLSLAIGSVVTLVSALLPAFQASRITPMAALQVRAKTEGGALLRWLWLPGLLIIALAWSALYVIPLRREVQYPVGVVSVFSLLLGATLLVPVTVNSLERVFRPLVTLVYRGEGRLGGSNVRRARGRTALTVAALMVGIAMILGLGGLATSMRTDLLSWVETAIGGDLYVRSPLGLRPEFGRRLASVEGVAAVAPVTYFNVRLAGSEDSLLFVALDPDSYTQVASFQFAAGQGNKEAMIQRLAQGDAVFISATVSDKYNLKQGDSIRLETARGERDFFVAAVIVDFSAQGYVVNGTRRDMERYFGQTMVDTFDVKVAPGVDSQEVRQRIEDSYKQSQHISIESSHEFRKRVTDLANQAFAMLDVLAFIGMIVAALAVVNTMTMNVLERQREVGSLRSLGMTRGQVARMILAEAGTMGLIGGLFGLGFGLFLSRVFVMAMHIVSGYSLNYVVPLQGIVVSVTIALGVSQLAAAYPAQRAAAVNIVEAIQHE
jgi:putative ABC transport system permease protein